MREKPEFNSKLNVLHKKDSNFCTAEIFVYLSWYLPKKELKELARMLAKPSTASCLSNDAVSVPLIVQKKLWT